MTTNMKALLGIDQNIVDNISQINVYEFMYGAKSIEVSQLQYSNIGLYVSKPFRISSPGAVGLDVDEVIPELTATQYRVIINYKDIVNNVEVGTEAVSSNLLPGHVALISDISYPEILDGSDNSTTNMAFDGQWFGYTRFAIDQSFPVTVNQNGIPMLSGTYNTELQPDGRVRIWFFSTNNVNRNISVFTVSYKPNISAYVLNLERHDIAYATLQIIPRSISSNRLLTPRISSYSMKFKKFGSL
jgi:hypothetical protein